MNNDEIRKHCGDDKLINGVNEELVFELTRDFADPTLDFLPFLFH